MTLLWIVHVWPEPSSSAAGIRTVQLLRIASQLGYQLHVASSCQSNSYREALEREGYTTHSIAPNDCAFDEFVRQLNPAIVVFDRFMIEEQFSWRIRAQCPHALRIIDTIDLHFLRQEREKRCGDVHQPNSKLSATLLRELAAIYRSDLSLIISRTEYELLLNTFNVPDCLLAYCPLGVEVCAQSPDYSARSGCTFIGNFTHAPNLDAVSLLRKGLWKEIRDACRARGTDPCLYLYGAYPPSAAHSWNDDREGIFFEGTPPDAKAALARHRVNLAPLRFGAGIKGKILDGWSVGVPAVATEVAAEGMSGLEGEFGGVIATSLEHFPTQVAELYCDKDKWNTASCQGSRLLKNYFSMQEVQDSFRDAIKESDARRDERRKKNLIGEMLWYHGNRSTEFMSRWIELKNASHKSAA